jgi:hypothetical protein
MSNSIESQIHRIILDIDPSLQKEYEEQAIIVAEASANYRLSTKTRSNRVASTQSKNEEALMIDSILGAMNTMIESDTTRVAYTGSYIDCSDGDLNYETILKNMRFSSKDFDDMSILNDGDFNSFLENQKKDNLVYSIEDIFENERPNSQLYVTKKNKKHHTDSTR